MKRTYLLLIFNLLLIGTAFGQIHNPVKWNITLEGNDVNREIVFRGTIEKGWHIYALDLPEGGPIATAVEFEELKQATLNGKVTPNKPAHEKYDDVFEMMLGEYSDQVEFRQSVHLDNLDNYKIIGSIGWQACQNGMCTPPSQQEFSFQGKDVKNTVIAPTHPNQQGGTRLTAQKGWQPVETENVLSDSTLLAIFLSGFVGGLLALLTPCVWPMIPLTVSFFLKKKQTRRKAIREAILYGVSIIVIYLGMGLLITLLFGAGTLNQLSTNAIFNVFFFLMLVVFAISFFGAFEITLPASWSNKLDRKADKATGVLAIFFMAFTLALVSFSCTGPIIGTLLVETATWGNTLAPAIGMAGFAIALAIPFALFAMFPSLMKQMPKSGGWLNTVKVVLGFLELALSLKFLSVADLAYGWGILDRETFLVLWIVIFTLLGFYLLGKITFAHDSKLNHVSVPRLFLAIISFAFALYMLPGLWGAPTKAISAFVPPMYTQDFNLSQQDVHAAFDDYDKALAFAQKENKPLLVDFSGYGCVNCREMEASVWTAPEVKEKLENEFVLVTLMVDDRQKLENPVIVEENGKEIKLKSVGDKWSFLQRHKFGANAQPYYVILDHEGNLLEKPYGYDKSATNFVTFLNNGLKAFHKK